MKFFCVGRNYREHAAELANEVPSSPLIFMKPSTAFLGSGNSFYIPDFTSDVHYELEIIVKIKEQAKGVAEKDALLLVDEISVGIDFTARDVQSEHKKKSWPWELAKSFDYSAVIGDWIPFDTEKLAESNFQLTKNGVLVQDGHAKDMIFTIPFLIHFISQRFTLQKGDIIFTGTPAGVGPVASGDVLEGFLNNQALLFCDIK